MFDLGKTYTRVEIHALLGGGLISYLPTNKGVVVCACLRPDMNPDAPRVILVGSGPRIRLAGELLCQQCGPIPVFIRRDTHAWEYAGRYRVRDRTQSLTEIKHHAKKVNRDDVTAIVYLEKARKEIH